MIYSLPSGRQMYVEKIDVDEARDVHALAFPADKWVGDEHTFWVARMREGKRKIVGFCSAIYRPETDDVFLSRCAVAADSYGLGIQRRLIRHRIAWAKRNPDARYVVTYTSWNNYPSMMNLLRLGFRFSKIIPPWTNETAHYFRKSLE